MCSHSSASPRPTDNNHLIKRVIGLPGDRVKCCNVSGKLTVNGVALSSSRIINLALPE